MTEEANVEAAEDTGPRTAKRANGIAKEAKLTVLATDNPKREGSAAFDRFAHYFDLGDDATVQDALDAGLIMGDIKYDFIHGSIEVEGAEVEEYEVSPRGPRASTDEADEEDDIDAEELDDASGF